MANDAELALLARAFFDKSCEYRYSYNFTWMGRPIIQYPQDIVAMQEIIWRISPQIIIETGVAHGGALVFYASLLELMGGDREVIGIDIEVRPHNRLAIESHRLAHRIHLIQGSSVVEETLRQVKGRVRKRQPVLVVLDSNHTHDHVLEELHLYSPFVGEGSYVIVLDTVIEDMPAGSFPNRPWDRGNNPKTAVHAFLENNDRFVIDEGMNEKLLISTAPDGYLRCIKDPQ